MVIEQFFVNRMIIQHKIVITELSIYIFSIMTTTFSGSSRLANFRQKKNSGYQDPLNIPADLKLTLPQDEKTPSYEPTQTFSNTRTSMRLFKGKIQRKQSSDHNEIKSTGLVQAQSVMQPQPKLSLYDPKEEMKLVLHDSPQVVEKKAVQQAPSKPTQKRIMIAKQVKQQPKQNQQVPLPPPPPQKQQDLNKTKKSEATKQQPKQQRQEYINPHDQKPIIKQQQVEQSKEQPQNESDLVLCPQGCGRKFNRKALQKHAKACKIVFMSKRKQFNSQAKRVTSKQQANLVKQNKLKEKNQFGKTKGFQKTGDNWKAASEDFRAAIKAVKKEEDDKDEQGDLDQINLEQVEKQAALNVVPCQYCEKMFAKVLIQKHLQNCVKKKEKEKEKQKKKGTGAAKKK